MPYKILYGTVLNFVQCRAIVDLPPLAGSEVGASKAGHVDGVHPTFRAHYLGPFYLAEHLLGRPGRTNLRVVRMGATDRARVAVRSSPRTPCMHNYWKRTPGQTNNKTAISSYGV